MNYVEFFARKYIESVLSDPRHKLHPSAIKEVADIAIKGLDYGIGTPGFKSVKTGDIVYNDMVTDRGDITDWLADFKSAKPIYFTDAPEDSGWTEEKLATLDPSLRSEVVYHLNRNAADGDSVASDAPDLSGLSPVRKMQLARSGGAVTGTATGVKATEGADISWMSPAEKMAYARRQEAAKKAQPASYEEWKAREAKSED